MAESVETEPRNEPADVEEDSSQGAALEEVLAWTCHRLDEIAGGNVGKIEGTYVDAQSGRPAWYGIGGETGRSAEIAERDDEAVTARPAA